MNKAQKDSAGTMRVLGRLMKYLFKYHKVAMITVFFCLILTAVSNAAAPIFLNNMIKVIGNGIEYGNLYGAAAGWNHVYPELIKIIVTMICIYILGIGANTLYTQLMANVTQTFLHQLRTDLFDKMQKLPIKYFDTHTHGDIMSHYTNDVDAVRQLVSQSIPNLFSAITMLVFLLCIMLYYSIWLSLIVFLSCSSCSSSPRTSAENRANSSCSSKCPSVKPKALSKR